MTNFTLEQIAEALAVSKRGAERRALRERWPYTEKPVRGGRKRFYRLEDLPVEVRAAVILKWGSDPLTPCPSPQGRGEDGGGPSPRGRGEVFEGALAGGAVSSLLLTSTSGAMPALPPAANLPPAAAGSFLEMRRSPISRALTAARRG